MIPRHSRRRMFLICSLGFLIVLLSCERSSRPLNLLLICVDTLRPDRLGYAGGRSNISPSIDRLAMEGVVFTNSFSVSGWTLPSMATILTGRYPCDHGATDFQYPMDPALPIMANILKAHGYNTAGFVSHVMLLPKYGFASGFETYDYSVLDVGHPHTVSTAEPLTNLAIDYLRDVEEPFFIWVHYFDPHTEYLEHPPYKHFGDSDIDRYDQEIAHTDHNIGRLLSELDRRKMVDNTVIIFTSDHGEEFGEHGGKLHFTVYDEVLHVPLVIKAPGLKHRIDTRLNDQIDLLPTVLSLLHVEPPELPGHNILAPATDHDPTIFYERNRPPGWNQCGLRRGWYKLTFIELADTTEVPAWKRARYATVKNVIPGMYLYDLSKDPGELNSLYSDDDKNSHKLFIELAKHFAGGDKAAVREIQIDKTLRKKLRSLGYIR